MRWGLIFLAAGLLAGCGNESEQRPAVDERQASIDHGRKLVEIAGCNDCHTEGYAMAGGEIPESEWLQGSVVGWSGPWGTTYPINLRLFMQMLDEDQWVAFARKQQSRPPMPWFAFRSMDEHDLRSLHRYIRSLGAAGLPAPAYLPPGTEPPLPAFTLQMPAPPAAGGSADSVQ